MYYRMVTVNADVHLPLISRNQYPRYFSIHREFPLVDIALHPQRNHPPSNLAYPPLQKQNGLDHPQAICTPICLVLQQSGVWVQGPLEIAPPLPLDTTLSISPS